MSRSSDAPWRSYFADFQKARDEAWEIVHGFMPHVKREQVDRSADHSLFFWIQARGSWHARGQPHEEPPLGDLVTLLTLGTEHCPYTGEWREVGVPEF